MDPLSALSIAAAVVQFVDFGAKLVGTGLEIYRSTESATEDNLETEALTTHTKFLASNIVSSQAANGSNTPDEANLQELARRCLLLSQELIDLLVSLKGTQLHRSWSAVRQAVLAKWNDGRVKSLQKRLDAIKSEVSLQLLGMLRYSTLQIMLKLSRAFTDGVFLSNSQRTFGSLLTEVNERCKDLELQNQATLTTLQHQVKAELDSKNELFDQMVGIRRLIEQGKVKEQPTLLQPGAEYAALLRMLAQVSASSTKQDISIARDTLLTDLAKVGLDSTDVATILRGQPLDYSAILSATAPACWNFVAPWADSLGQLAQETGPLVRQLPILESLTFREMPHRELEITNAFANTYTWIFDPSGSPFAKWLQSGSGTFWISGNPGSGKSTLMKLITQFQDVKTTELLRPWSDGKNLVVSKHFFWGTGTALQKSYRGLLQGLVYQILRENLNLVQSACPERWDDQSWVSRRLPRPWTEDELKNTLHSVITKNAASEAFCFFLDGLDEFAEDHFSLITELVQQYSAMPHVKFCVSSRPYPVFSKAFGDTGCPTFALQELNGQDIDQFVRGKLESDRRFKVLTQRDVRAADLADEIRRRAAGVFLWVHLVVWELMSGLNNDDDYLTLRRRLDQLPRTLKEFFAHILDSVEPVYQGCTARSLMLAHRAKDPLPIMTYAYLYDDYNNPRFLPKIEVEPLSRLEIRRYKEDVTIKISSWCRGLMKVVTYNTDNIWEPLRRYRVDFLHRSVRDFLDTSDMQRFLHDKIGSGFDPEEMLAHLFVAQAKVVDVQTGLDDEMRAFEFMSDQAEYYAHLRDQIKGDEVETFGSQIRQDLDVVKRALMQQNGASQLPHAMPPAQENTLRPPYAMPGQQRRGREASPGLKKSHLRALIGKFRGL